MVKELFLNDIENIEIIGGQITSRVEAKTESEALGEIKVLIPKAINKGIVEKDSLGSLTYRTIIDEKKITKKGDIVIKLTTPYDSCLITEEDEGLLVPSFGLIIRTDDKFLSKKYLVAFLNSNYCINQLKNMVLGTVMPVLSTGSIKKIKIMVPSIEVQNEIGDTFTKVIEKEKLFKKIIDLEYEKLDSLIYEIKE